MKLVKVKLKDNTTCIINASDFMHIHLISEKTAVLDTVHTFKVSGGYELHEDTNIEELISLISEYE